MLYKLTITEKKFIMQQNLDKAITNYISKFKYEPSYVIMNNNTYWLFNTYDNEYNDNFSGRKYYYYNRVEGGCLKLKIAECASMADGEVEVI